MIRIVLLIVLSLALMTLTVWAYRLPGGVTIEITGYRLRAEYAVVIIALLAMFVLSGLLWWLMYAVIYGPTVLARRIRRRRSSNALERMGQGFLALAAGDVIEAQRFRAVARKALPDHPAQQLLSAQIAEVNNDQPAAKMAWENLLGQGTLDAAGRRGLYLLNLRQGNYEAAQEHAVAAFSSWPNLQWAGEALFNIQCRQHDWDGALATLERLGKRRSAALGGTSHERRKAVLLTAKGMNTPPEDSGDAMELLQQAWKLDNSLVPAAVFAAILLSRAERYAQAEKILLATWKQFAHPDVIDTYLRLRPGVSRQEALKRARTMAGDEPSSVAGAMALAQAYLDVGNLEQAERVLIPYGNLSPIQGVCLMMAEIVGRDIHRLGEARRWLAKARTAIPDPKWVSDGIASDTWSPVSPITAQLDVAKWQSPQAQSEPEAASIRRVTAVVDKEELEPTRARESTDVMA